MKRRFLIVLIIITKLNLVALAQTDSLLMLWEEDCSIWFKDVKQYVLNKEKMANSQYVFLAALANAYGYLNLYNTKKDNQYFINAYAEKDKIKQTIKQSPLCLQTYDALRTKNPCFAEKLDSLDNYFKRAFIKPFDSIPNPPIDLPCSLVFFQKEIDPIEGEITFKISIRDCQKAEAGYKGVKIAQVLKPAYYNAIYEWILQESKKQGVLLSEMDFEVETQGYSDSIPVENTIFFDFDIGLIEGTSYQYFDKMLDREYDRTLPISINTSIGKSLMANEFLALARAKTAATALENVDSTPLLVSKWYPYKDSPNEPQGLYRGVDIIISSHKFFTNMVRIEEEKIKKIIDSKITPKKSN